MTNEWGGQGSDKCVAISRFRDNMPFDDHCTAPCADRFTNDAHRVIDAGLLTIHDEELRRDIFRTATGSET